MTGLTIAWKMTRVFSPAWSVPERACGRGRESSWKTLMSDNKCQHADARRDLTCRECTTIHFDVGRFRTHLPVYARNLRHSGNSLQLRLPGQRIEEQSDSILFRSHFDRAFVDALQHCA